MSEQSSPPTTSGLPAPEGVAGQSAVDAALSGGSATESQAVGEKALTGLEPRGPLTANTLAEGSATGVPESAYVDEAGNFFLNLIGGMSTSALILTGMFVLGIVAAIAAAIYYGYQGGTNAKQAEAVVDQVRDPNSEESLRSLRNATQGAGATQAHTPRTKQAGSATPPAPQDYGDEPALGTWTVSESEVVTDSSGTRPGTYSGYTSPVRVSKRGDGTYDFYPLPFGSDCDFVCKRTASTSYECDSKTESWKGHGEFEIDGVSFKGWFSIDVFRMSRKVQDTYTGTRGND
jgi:hypothetical protein